MHNLSVTLETCTPMFMGDADPAEPPQLRMPSIRGVLRYWYRAALGSSLGDDLAELKKRESLVFGIAADPDKHEGAGNVATRLSGKSSLKPMSPTEVTGGGFSGRAYLWFTALQNNRSALTGQFGIQLTTRRQLHQEQLQQAAAALWLMSHLGSVGSRSHRGAGSLQVTRVESTDQAILDHLPKFEVKAISAETLTHELSEGIKKAIKIIAPDTGSATQDFDVLHNSVCRIAVVRDTFDSWKDALDWLGDSYKQFRTDNSADGQVVKQAMRSASNLSGPVARIAFGLPIQYYFKQEQNKKATVIAELANKDHTKIDRRTSPLSFRVTRLLGGRYAVVVIWFKSTFLPPNAQLQLQGTNSTGKVPDDSLVQQFFDGLNGLEVAL